MNGFDPAVDAFSAAAGNRSGSGAFDLSEVDFEFVERCTKKDARKLANIVRALESDGGYPQLLSAARNKLASIDPTSAPLVSAPASRDEQRDAIADLASWTATAKAQESALRSSSAAKSASSSSSSAAAAAARPSIPIRGHTDSAFEPAPANSASAELKRKNAAAGVDLGQELDPAVLSPVELAAAACSEKEKGNECFRAGEHADAVKFYTRALHLTPKDSTVLNNRALTFLRLKNLDAALNDVMLVLAADATNWKALWRRGQIHEAKLFLERALDDFKLAQEAWARTPDAARTHSTHPDIAKNVRKVQKALLESEPNHPYVAHLKDKPTTAAAAKSLANEEKESKEPEGPAAAVAAATAFKRMAIAEVDDDESDEDEDEEEKSAASAGAAKPAVAAAAAPASAPMRRMPIAEVDDDDDDDDEPAVVAPAAAPAAKPVSAAAAPKPAVAAAAAPAASPPAKKPAQPSQPSFTSKSGGMMIELVSDDDEEADAEEKEKAAAIRGAASASSSAAAAAAARPTAVAAAASASSTAASLSSAFVVPPAPSSSVLFSRDWAELTAAGCSSVQHWSYLSQLAPAAVSKLFASGGALNTHTFAGLIRCIVDGAFAAGADADAARAMDYLAALERTERFALNVSMMDKDIKALVVAKLDQVSKGANEELAAKAAALRKRYA